MAETEAKTPVQEPEGIQTGKMLLIASGTLAVFILAVWGVWGLQVLFGAALPDAAPPEVTRPRIGIPDQRDFRLTPRGDLLRERDLQALESYGWVQADAGRIHIPVERAMDELAREQGGATP